MNACRAAAEISSESDFRLTKPEIRTGRSHRQPTRETERQRRKEGKDREREGEDIKVQQFYVGECE